LIVVSDTSPIRALDFLGLLPILNDLVDRVLVPPAVRDELNSPLPQLDHGPFTWNWFALAVLVVVGIPTLSAYCFVYWLGPWYLYGP
jgi:predicted nucleic acid-binding protein